MGSLMACARRQKSGEDDQFKPCAAQALFGQRLRRGT